jgi:FkbH-like protein
MIFRIPVAEPLSWLTINHAGPAVMLDNASLPECPLAALRKALFAKPPTLPAIFQTGDRIIAATAGPLGEPATISPSLPLQRVAVLGSVTIDYLSRAVACGILAEGMAPVVYQAPFGSYIQEILDPTSPLHGFGPDLAVIAPTWRDLVATLPIAASATEADAALDVQVGLFGTLWDRLGANGVKIIQHTQVPPTARYCGIAERLAPAAPANQVRRLNEMLLQAGRGRVHWVDMETLAEEIGARAFGATRFWHTAKLDFDLRWLPDYLKLFRAAWRAANARAKKVLVLDLDNTLWGGVIGDDGADGIAIGPGSAAGETFAEWQSYVKALGERGIVLAVCSKNSPEIAATGFGIPNSVLRREDFAAFECSWADKAGGLKRIAKDLNVGIDSFVFADDNPAECELVRQELPEVAVVHLGDDPGQFIERLDDGRWFDMPHYTTEDLGRAAAYGARAAALAEQSQATDLGGFLRGLEMKGRLYRPEEADIPRVAQLEQKTNQFNVTTRRYAEAAIRGFLTRNDAVVLALRLADRLGDHGLVSTLIAFQEDATLRIDSWLMSCRVFSRSAEPFILRGLIDLARQRGVTRLAGEYLPTPKNDVVADLYERMGFTRADNEGMWSRPVTPSEPHDLVTYIAGG